MRSLKLKEDECVLKKVFKIKHVYKANGGKFNLLFIIVRYVFINDDRRFIHITSTIHNMMRI